jgi:hypothetical protein
MVFEVQPPDHPPRQLAAPENLILRAVIRRRFLPERRVVHAEIADRRAALVFDLDSRRGLVDRNRRVGLHHHRGDDEQERGSREPAMLEDGIEPVEEMDRLAAAARGQRDHARRVCGQPPRAQLLGVEHGYGWMLTVIARRR